MSGPDPQPVDAYRVRALRNGHGWELRVTDPRGAPVGQTRVRRLTDAATAARAEMPDVPSTAPITVVPEIPGGLIEEVAALRAEQRAMAARQVALAAQARAIARRLKDAGLTGSEVGLVMGVSEQRASQLLRDHGTGPTAL